LRKLFFEKKVFLHGEKENFEEYSLFLESAELSFAILINYSARKWRTYPRTTVFYRYKVEASIPKSNLFMHSKNPK
jgi:hypothetical protein